MGPVFDSPYDNLNKVLSEENGKNFDYQVLATNFQLNDSIFFFTQAWRSYFDVVFGPVDAADGHAQAAQAALVHVAGDGAAHNTRAARG